MSRRAPWALALCVLAVALLVPRPASAEGRPFRIAYEAPDGCPPADAMTNRILASSARARLADPIEPAVELGARILAQSGGFIGYLRVRALDWNETMRAVPAATCEEVVSAMSLIAVTVVDPDAVLPPADAAAEAAPAPAEKPPEHAGTPAAQKTPTAAPEGTPVPEPALADADRAAPRRAPPRFWIVATGEAGLEGAIAPDPAPDFALGIGVVDTRPRLFAPSVRLSARWATSANVISQGNGTVSFERLGGRLSGCPLRAEVGPVGLRPCAFLELGSLHAHTSSAVAAPNSPTVLWGAFGVTGRGETLLFGWLVLGVELGALFPFRHDDFYYLPLYTRAYRVDVAGFVGALDVAVRFL